jgi:hypothetical protein
MQFIIQPLNKFAVKFCYGLVRCFLPSFGSIGKAVAEEMIKMRKASRKWMPSNAKSSHGLLGRCIFHKILMQFFIQPLTKFAVKLCYGLVLVIKLIILPKNKICIKIGQKIRKFKFWNSAFVGPF